MGEPTMRFRKSGQKGIEVDGQEALFPVAEFEVTAPIELKPLESRLWTKSKAALVARYLYYFVLITHHGTYIDAFAGPQSELEEADSGWTARRVLEIEPSWLNKFLFFELDPAQLAHLEALKAEYAERNILITPDDVNRTLPQLLAAGSLREKEAILLPSRSTHI